MNAPYPYPIPNMQGDVAAFIANATGVLGSYDKPLDASTKVSVDYSQTVPALAVTSYSFRVSPGGSPQLSVSASSLISSTLLGFLVSGGIGGRAYTVTINAMLMNGSVRSDVLTVNVQDDDDCGCVVVNPPPLNGGVTSPDGALFVNAAPRFFVSNTPPNGAMVMDQWYNTGTGVLYSNATNGAVNNWVPITGGGGGGGSVNINKLDQIIPDGVMTLFILTLAGAPVTIIGTNSLLVSVDGVWQEPSTQYEAFGSQITFTEAPTADAKIFMLWFG